MTTQEKAILDAINIASTVYRRRGHNFECTPAQIVEVLATDERLAAEYHPDVLHITTRQLGQRLAVLAGTKKGWPTSRAGSGLVEKVDDRRYRLSKWGLKVMSL